MSKPDLNSHNHTPDAEYEQARLEASNAFENAVQAGRLSDKPSENNFAGNFMYMGKSESGKDLFKHIITRKYLD